MARKIADCRSSPNVAGCTLTISGEEEEVLACAINHAVAVHGHARTPELREGIRSTLTTEEADVEQEAEAREPASLH